MPPYKKGRPFKYRPSTKEGTKPPHKAGEYRIRDDDGNIVYIGETNDLARRTNEHIRSGKLPQNSKSTIEFKIADGRSSSHTRRQHEQEKIKQHHPSLNKSRGGEGRPSKK